MGAPQKMIIDGQSFVLVPEADYEDLIDVAHARAIVARGEESFPAEIVKEILGGANPVRVFRKYRGMTQAELGAASGLTQVAIAGLETGRRAGRPETMKAIAEALGVGLDDIM